MFTAYRSDCFREAVYRLEVHPVDLLVAGVTGAGKSTTLNAIFGREVAKVGRGVDPETMAVNDYLPNDLFRIWDTPGLGDGVAKDEAHSRKIIDLLCETYDYKSERYGLIDLVLVVVEGGSRDMGTTYRLLNEVVIPNISGDRVIIAINQADLSMKGRWWDYDNNVPLEKLRNFLDAQALSIRDRVMEATGEKVALPVCYAAEYGYNIPRVLDVLIDHIPKERRRISDVNAF